MSKIYDQGQVRYTTPWGIVSGFGRESILEFDFRGRMAFFLLYDINEDSYYSCLYAVPSSTVDESIRVASDIGDGDSWPTDDILGRMTVLIEDTHEPALGVTVPGIHPLYMEVEGHGAIETAYAFRVDDQGGLEPKKLVNMPTMPGDILVTPDNEDDVYTVPMCEITDASSVSAATEVFLGYAAEKIPPSPLSTGLIREWEMYLTEFVSATGSISESFKALRENIQSSSEPRTVNNILSYGNGIIGFTMYAEGPHAPIAPKFDIRYIRDATALAKGEVNMHDFEYFIKDVFDTEEEVQCI